MGSPDAMTQTAPVALFVYKRVDVAERVFQRIAAARPRQLLIVADGPEVESDRPACEACRGLAQRVDWDCELLLNYSTSHLGLRQRLISGLNWVFDNTEEAILLEEDCLPDPSFFPFCTELLERYRETPRLMMISGRGLVDTNPADGPAYSYRFRPLGSIWGWATWRRAWQGCDFEMRAWADLHKTGWLEERFKNPFTAMRLRRGFNLEFMKVSEEWAYSWFLYCLLRGGLAAVPTVHMVTNVGIRDDATNTKPALMEPEEWDPQTMEFPLCHPPLWTPACGSGPSEPLAAMPGTSA